MSDLGHSSCRDFEKFEKLPNEKKRPKHEPTESYFRLARQLVECMMRSDKLNWYGHGGYTKMTAPSSNIVVTNESESKRSNVNEKLSQKYSLSQNISVIIFRLRYCVFIRSRS